MPFFVIFVAIPFIEIMIFLSIGESIGFLTTLVLALGTAILGGFIVQYQGLTTLRSIQSTLSRGKVPVGDLFDGVCLIAAGATLITPGFLTDFIGFMLLIPLVRKALSNVIKTRTSWGLETPDMAEPQSSPRSAPADIIEGEYERVDDK